MYYQRMILIRATASVCLLLASALAAAAADDGGLKRRGYFGLRTKATDPAGGTQIREVRPAGFAESAKLLEGDVIVSINRRPVKTPPEFRAMIRTMRSGEKVSVEFRRGADAKPQTVEGVLPGEPYETYATADVIYDSVAGAANKRLRTIVTKPKKATGKVPVIFVAGWLSDDSIEAPDGTKDPTASVLRGIAELPGFATFRVDKPGSGDSEGDCAETDFETELAGYRAAFASLARHDFIDTDRVFILGISNGGGFAPLVPATPADAARVRGYVSVGGWVKTWFEHMMQIERDRLGLSGKTPGEVNSAMKELAGFYGDMLLKGEKPAQIFARRPATKDLWPGDDATHLYGRPIAFYQQLQKLNLAEAWSKVNVPTLVMHGHDWIMGKEDSELIASYVNANSAGAAEFVELPNTGHTFQNYTSLAAAFKGESQPFDPAILKRVTDWFESHRDG